MGARFTDYPCPSLRELVEADVLHKIYLITALKSRMGQMPHCDIIEMDKELILNLGYIAGRIIIN